MITYDTAKEYVEKIALDAMKVTDKSDEVIQSLALNFYLIADYIMTYGEINLDGIPVQETINMTGDVTEPSEIIGMTAGSMKTGRLS